MNHTLRCVMGVGTLSLEYDGVEETATTKSTKTKATKGTEYIKGQKQMKINKSTFPLTKYKFDLSYI